MAYTKEQQREYAKQHYQNNKERYKARAKLNRPKYREETRLFLFKYLEANPCVDCGETDILVLEFDHRDKKNFNITSNARSRAAIVDEMKLCDVVCANCHTRRTHTRANSERFRYISNPS